MSMYAYDKTPERLARARAAVDRALTLDPESPGAHLALGRYHEIADGNRQRALEEYTFVATRRPNDSVAARRIAWVRLRLGEFDGGVTQLERAFELGPRDANVAEGLGEMYRFLARYSEADRRLDLAISLAPDKFSAYAYKAMSYMEQGRLSRARATAEGMPEVDQFFFFFVWWISSGGRGTTARRWTAWRASAPKRRRSTGTTPTPVQQRAFDLLNLAPRL